MNLCLFCWLLAAACVIPQAYGQQARRGQGRSGGGQGVCPRPNPPSASCSSRSSCQDDSQCGPGSKCCDTGCGRACRRVSADGRSNQSGQRGPNSRGQAGATFNLQRPQSNLPPQPSLVGLGGCSRGATLRNPDGSTLVCGFGSRDFACPTNFSCVFDSILKALVCCPSDDATPAPTPSPPNPCPDGEPLKDEFSNHLQCSLNGAQAVHVSTCPSGTLCVEGICCRPQSVAGFLSVKPGQCPQPLPIAQNGPCPNECVFDAECQGSLKCCFNGCGARCASAGSENGAAAGAQPPGAAGFGSGNGGFGQQPGFDLAASRGDGFSSQQRQSGFPGQGGFSGDQQGGAFGGRGSAGFGGQQRGAALPQFAPPGFSGRAQKDFAAKSEGLPKGIVFRPGVAPVTANDTCEEATCPPCHECSEATGMAHCVRMPDCCPDGSSPTACHSNPCLHAKCPDNPEAFCFPDGCSNLCRAVYYDRMGNLASCPTKSNL